MGKGGIEKTLMLAMMGRMQLKEGTDKSSSVLSLQAAVVPWYK